MSDKKIEGVERLAELEIGEIVKKTHIEAEYVEAIVTKNFDRLKDKNVYAFIKIIEREFGVDMGTWLDEYKASVSLDEEKAAFVPVSSREIVIKDHNKLPKIIFWLVLIAIVAWAIFNFKLYDLTQFKSKNSTTSYSSNTTMVEVAGDKLENVGVEIISLDEPLKVAENNETKGLNALEKSIILESIDTNDVNLTIDDNITASDIEEDLAPSGASIVPASNIWIGIIDVATKKKSTVTTDKEYKIDLNKEQLILTGHGIFGLKIDENTQNFNDKNPHRLHIKDGKVKQISYDEFLKLNDGKAW